MILDKGYPKENVPAPLKEERKDQHLETSKDKLNDMVFFSSELVERKSNKSME